MISEQMKAEGSRRGNSTFGPKVDFHCPYDETTLRVSLRHEGFHICPICRTLFEAEPAPPTPEPKPPIASDAWFMRFIRRLFRKPEGSPNDH